MNVAKLRELAASAESQAAAQRELADSLALLVEQVESQRDPLGSYIFRARAAYRRALDSDHSKSGKSTATHLIISYQRAAELGFTGGPKVWELLMRCS